MSSLVVDVDINHAHLACGLGAGARGFNNGQARVGNLRARFNCIGGIDVDPAAIRDFGRMTGTPGTVRDLFTVDQYRRFHDKAPPADFVEATPQDLHAAFQHKHPHILFISAPCKGFSGLLAEEVSKTVKYQALNELTLRCLWLALEAYQDDPIELIIFENVPRIATRGRHLLDQIISMLRYYGYAVAETTHDCGELGGLAQSRKRFLLVARHAAKVQPFLYEPPKQRLRGVGEVLDKLPLPDDPRAPDMHRMPKLQWQTWVRLAFVEAGKDWRSLKDLVVEDGVLRDYGIMPERPWRDGTLGVLHYGASAGVISANAEATTGRYSVADPRETAQWHPGAYGVQAFNATAGVVREGRPGQGVFSVADPRVDGHHKSVQLGVRRWSCSAPCIKGDVSVGTGPYAISDPRFKDTGPRFSNVYRIVPWENTGPVVTSARGALAAVADPRHPGSDYVHTKYLVTPYRGASRTVIGASTTGDGAYAVADPRVELWATGQAGVMRWRDTAGVLTTARSPLQGMFSVADPRTGFGENSHRNKLRVVGYRGSAGTVTGSDRVGSGALSVADPRPIGLTAYKTVRCDHYGVVKYTDTTGAVLANAHPWDNGRWSVADPRPIGLAHKDRDTYANQGHYGVVPWRNASNAVPAYAKNNNGFWSVGDPRVVLPDAQVMRALALPDAKDRLVAVIRALDGTWHRPFTTLELAALQSLFNLEDAWFFQLEGKSDADKRERIGNAVPSDSATAIASVMGKTLLMAMTGTSFILSNEPIWVQPLALALAVRTEDQPYLEAPDFELVQ
ncbi:DNA cytosine methyltransferase [Caulobacter sp. Root343]|uniref:DNA cytosine methyltransferase n=1 Tax=Caulobacter sp. Root343 TaxID=1736520 RepID=UPI0006FAE13A|nr:DNA cytosine methyltransferase [Caulobacter sp. Root343]KQV66604.1 hypothetical protein ASC70_12280 [Caulobacter sp. Root343]